MVEGGYGVVKVVEVDILQRLELGQTERGELKDLTA
jgi:hypothetical protein